MWKIRETIAVLCQRLIILLPERWRSGRRLKILSGASWSFIGQGGTQALRLVSTLVLAKLLLSPEAFGLVALVNVFIAGLEMLSDVGLGPNIIQHARGEEPLFLQTAFSVQVIRGVCLWLIATGLAFPFAWFYDQPEIGPLIVVGSLGTLFRSFSHTGIHALTRRVVIRPITCLTLGSELAGFAVSVSWAFLAPSAWALVMGTVVTAVSFGLGSHLIVGWRQRFCWESKSVQEIVRFGGWVFIGTATYYFASQGERLLLGKYTTVAQLGCFALAARIAMIPQQFMLRLSSYVVFPMIADSLRRDRRQGVKHYAKIRNMLMCLVVVVALIFIACSGPVVALLLDPEYSDVAWMLPLLGIRSSFGLLGTLSSSLILSMGQSRYSAMQNTMTLVLILVGLHVSFTMTAQPLVWAMVVLAMTPSVSSVVFVRAVATLAPELLRSEILIFISRILIGIGLIILSLTLYGKLRGVS